MTILYYFNSDEASGLGHARTTTDHLNLRTLSAWDLLPFSVSTTGRRNDVGWLLLLV